jgi:hypothetical protein
MADTEKPAIGSIWRHRNGCEYRVIMFTNEPGDRLKYPINIVYENTENGNKYSRLLSDWHRSMTRAGE